ncbi:MAG: hypothetical protein WD358_07480 [Nitriliruptoraceae bacterium]
MARKLALWSPDWPLTAAGLTPEEPAAIIRDGRIMAATAAARQAGVRAGLRRREAEARCSGIEIFGDDPDRDARMFTPVVAEVAGLVPATEVVRPGLFMIDVHTASRALGGQTAIAEQLRQTVDPLIDWGPACRIGIAEIRFAALLAARAAPPDDGCLAIDDDQTHRFLALQPVTVLPAGLEGDDSGAVGRERAQRLANFVALLMKLGITTLGQLADLPLRHIADRFGDVGIWAHQLARGAGDAGVVRVEMAEDLLVHSDLDPPAERLDTVAFAGRGLAERLLTVLASQQLRCRLVAVEAQTAHGERLERHWRASDGFTATALTDRVRWQLDGWLNGTAGVQRPTAGISRLTLTPLEIVQGGAQVSLLDTTSDDDRNVVQTLVRLQGLLGQEAVLVGAVSGGRDPSDWVLAVPWDIAASDVAASKTAVDERPWPSRLPSPAPATVLAYPTAAEVVDRHGNPVSVSGRGEVSAPPVSVRCCDGQWRAVVAWAGPWPADERWWDVQGRRRARFQMLTEDGAGLLASLEAGRWQIEASYD